LTTENILWIIAITIIALLIAIFQYFFKTKRKSKKTILFAFLRFLSVFIILLLLVNPKITITNGVEEKPELTILVDQSQSITHLNQTEQVKEILAKLKENNALSNKFDVSIYGFGKQLTDSITNTFSERQTKIQQTLVDIQKVHRKPHSPVVLISDGNQTYGQDYSYYKSKFQQPIFSFPLGDTTAVADLHIKAVNANKYVYLNNEFPIEILSNYSGNGTQESTLSVYRGKQKIYSKKLLFSKNKKSYFVTPKLKANKAGLHNYSVSLSPLEGEKNTINNKRQVLIETIDQKTSVLLVSNTTHPDIGVLKRSIEGNKRRRLKIVKSTEVNVLDNIELVILYQPDRNFKKVYELCEKAQMPLFTITGKKTDWNFINGLQRNYQKAQRTQVEDVLPVLNSNFEIFNTDQFKLDKYPPLESSFGRETLQSPYETLLVKKIANVTTEYPLLAFWNTKNNSEAVLFGEGIWKWRLTNYKRDGNFEKFDDLFGKLIQYLSNKKVRKRLTITYENEYYTNNSVLISASYFNKNYEFDTKAQLVLVVTKEGEKESKKIPMELKGSFYEAEFSSLQAGIYRFVVNVQGTKQKGYGGFVVQDFDVEKQFRNPNITSLTKLTSRNKGKLIYPNQIDDFIKELIDNESYRPIIKYNKEQKSLIDWKFLLAILIMLLGLEWFLRKYNGLI